MQVDYLACLHCVIKTEPAIGEKTYKYGGQVTIYVGSADMHVNDANLAYCKQVNCLNK